ncbi:MAG: hypothetical protein KC493_05695, partial [Bacteriovoracaceae bacterium]|nr:hypothetical protein [Bacteriovoracaceae bacterium]
LARIVMTLGIWGQKFIEDEFSEYDLDPSLLMWDIQRRLDTKFFPKKGRFVSHFYLVGAPKERRNWWLVVRDRNVDLCVHHPGFEEDISVEACLRGLTEVWMGQTTVEEAKKKNHLIFNGDKKYIKSFKDWFLLSPFAEHHPNS